jgi:hypothetical protein
LLGSSPVLSRKGNETVYRLWQNYKQSLQPAHTALLPVEEEYILKICVFLLPEFRKFCKDLPSQRIKGSRTVNFYYLSGVIIE